MTLGQRLAVMREGRIEQVADPMEIYRRPATLFVAEFIGSPSMNLFPAESDANGRVRLAAGPTLALPVPPNAARGRGIVLGIRPHDIGLVSPGAGDFVARVDIIEHRGSDLLIRSTLDTDARMPLTAVAPPEAPVRLDKTVGVSLDRERLHWFDAETGARIG